MSIAKSQDKNPIMREAITKELKDLPAAIDESLDTKTAIQKITPAIAEKNNALFLGRGIFFPIVQEGALKLKEISYIHAEA